LLVAAQGTLLCGILSISYGPRFVLAYGIVIGSISYWIKRQYGFERFLWMVLSKCGMGDAPVTTNDSKKKD